MKEQVPPNDMRDDGDEALLEFVLEAVAKAR